MINQFIAATHTAVRERLLKMQKLGGAMIQPLILYKILSGIMAIYDEDKITKMSKTQVRDISATFCALCNEFYLIYSKDRNPRTEFYVSEERWEKYYLGQKARENSINLLQRYDFIRCAKMKNPHKGAKFITVYTINLDMLDGCCEMAEDIHDKVNTQQYKEFLDKFDEAYARACARA